MKKIGIIMAAFALTLASCEDKTTAEPQYNPQEPVMGADALAVQVPTATATAVNLSSYTNEKGLIPVLDITKLENFPENYKLKGVMTLSNDESYKKSREINLIYDDDAKTLYANVDDWESAHLALFSKNPREAETYMKIALYGVNGSTVYRLAEGDNQDFGERALKVTPFPAKVIVEDAYYLVGDAEGQMNASNPADVYDPPTFSLKVNVPVNGKVSVNVKSESGKVYGQSPEQADGLVLDGAAIEIDQAGPRLLTVNMETMTYEVSLAIESIYAYGSSPSIGYELTTDNYVNYCGFAGLNLGYFRLADAKKGYTMRWGQAVDADGEAIEGSIELQDSPKMIHLENKGCHYLNANLSALTYTAYYVEKFSLIGGWDEWTNDVDLTATDRYSMVWTGQITITNGTKFKIRTNGDWEGPNLGISASFTGTGYYELQEHGSDIEWNLGDGNFEVTLDLTAVPYTLKAKAIN